ncbi:MAG TPA: DUF3147 family protein [Acidobacteriaceae bacterium]|nr:DUF3147 family protein [Acidobacteriaceae bacterium]
MTDILLRFLIGGAMVALFSFIGCMFSPKSFAGLFGAAPSVALATLLLTVSHSGKQYAAIETRSMVGGGIAFLLYAFCVALILSTKRFSALSATLASMTVWFGSALIVWLVWIR